MGNIKALDPLNLRQANPVEFGELLTSQGLNVEEGIWPALHTLVGNSSRSPDEPKVR